MSSHQWTFKYILRLYYAFQSELWANTFVDSLWKTLYSNFWNRSKTYFCLLAKCQPSCLFEFAFPAASVIMQWIPWVAADKRENTSDVKGRCGPVRCPTKTTPGARTGLLSYHHTTVFPDCVSFWLLCAIVFSFSALSSSSFSPFSGCPSHWTPKSGHNGCCQNVGISLVNIEHH